MEFTNYIDGRAHFQKIKMNPRPELLEDLENNLSILKEKMLLRNEREEIDELLDEVEGFKTLIQNRPSEPKQSLDHTRKKIIPINKVPDLSIKVMSFNRPGLMKRTEQALYRMVLEHFEGNRTRTAVALGVSIRTLRNKLIQFEKNYKEREMDITTDSRFKKDQISGILEQGYFLTHETWEPEESISQDPEHGKIVDEEGNPFPMEALSSDVYDDGWKVLESEEEDEEEDAGLSYDEALAFMGEPPKSGRRRLSDEQLEKVIALNELGYPYKQIAPKFGFTEKNVNSLSTMVRKYKLRTGKL